MGKHWYAILSVAISAALLSGCLPGLDPSWKAESGAATLTIRIGSLVTSESLANAAVDLTSARAVIQGGGYLYVRTLGGPADDSGPFYGPYTVGADATCRITDIPAGIYTGMGILYSGVSLEERSFYYNDMPLTFVELMRLPDAEFNALSTGTVVDNVYHPSPFENLLDGDASGEMLKDVNLAAGKENSFRLRLKPMTGGEKVVFTGQTGAVTHMVTPTAAIQRKFIALEGISAPLGYSIVSLKCSAAVSPTTGGTVDLGRIALYDETGALIYADPSASSSITGAGTHDVIAPYAIVPTDGSKTLYLYVEHSSATGAPFILTFTATLSPLSGDQRLIVTYSGSMADAGKRVFYGIYPPSAIGIDGLVGEPVAMGMIVLNSSGYGSCDAVDVTTRAVMQFAPYSTYVVTAFLDNAGTYAGYADMASIASIDGITPHYNDYTIDGMGVEVPIVEGITNFDITSHIAYPMKTHVFFVSSGGAGGGQTTDDPSNITAVLSSAVNLVGIEPGDIEIILTMNDSLDASVSRSIPYRLRLRSLGATPFTLSLAGAATTSSPFLIQSGGGMSLRNITVSGSSYSGTVSPFNVGMDASLDLEAGATIRSFTLGTGSSGGAISTYGGEIKMSSAVIEYCQADNGGAVYIGYGSTSPSMLTMLDGAIIRNCSAMTGGGVYVSGMAGLTLMRIVTPPSITANNASTDGGGVYVQSGGTIYDPLTINASVVTGNTLLGAGTNDIANYGTIDSAVHQMYVSQAGTGDGLSPTTPASFATALATPSVTNIVLVDDITLASPVEITRALTLSGASQLGNALLLASTFATPFLTVTSSASLSVYNVKLGPATVGGGSAPSIVRVEYGSTLNLGDGASIRNNSYAGNGAGVNLVGGYLTLNEGSSIVACGSSLYSGGGVYAGTYFDGTNTFGSSVMFNGGAVENCSAAKGAGFYVVAPSSMYLGAGAISHNVATSQGGGIYVELSATLNLFGSLFSITGNDAGTAGGGVYAQDGAIVSEGTTGISLTNITGNTVASVVETAGITTGN